MPESFYQILLFINYLKQFKLNPHDPFVSLPNVYKFSINYIVSLNSIQPNNFLINLNN